MQTQALLKKAAGLDIQLICSLHGPIWRENLSYIIDKYDKWSKYEPEDKEVVMIYGSVYGHTEQAVDALAGKLAEKESAILQYMMFQNPCIRIDRRNLPCKSYCNCLRDLQRRNLSSDGEPVKRHESVISTEAHGCIDG